MKFLPKAVLAGALVLSLLGCSTKFEVESNTTWQGYVKDHSVAGSGASTFSAHKGDVATFQKQTEYGQLKARCKGWNGDGRWVETTAPYGVVTVNTR